jgi:hypothetical protein
MVRVVVAMSVWSRPFEDDAEPAAAEVCPDPACPRDTSTSGTAANAHVYEYTDVAGAVLYEVVRTPPKRFTQRRPDGCGGWAYDLDGVERVPYRLPEVNEAASTGRMVFVVEGEKDADRLVDFGLTATTNAQGANYAWPQSWAEHVRGCERVVVIADNDEPGRRHAHQVAEVVSTTVDDVRVIEALPSVGEKGDVSDWLDAGGTIEQLWKLVEATLNVPRTLTDSANSANSASTGTDAWPDPLPLRVARALPSFPTRVFTPWAQEFIEAVAVAIQTPVDLPAMLVLSVLAAAIPAVKVRVRPNWVEPTCLYVVVALPSGERKSPVFKMITAPLEGLEAQWLSDWQRESIEASARYEVADAAATKALEMAKKARSEGREDHEKLMEDAVVLRREANDVLMPAPPRLIADDVTQEALGSLLADQKGNLAVLSAEGGIFEILGGRYTEGRPNIEVFLKGHSGDALRVDRRGRPPEHIEEPRLVLGLTVQPTVIEGLSRHRGFRGKGLLARMLYSFPVSRVGSREPDAPPVPEGMITTYLAEVSKLARVGFRGGPVDLVLDSEAANLLNNFLRELEPRLAPIGDLGHVADWGNKLGGTVVRIAALLHVSARGLSERAIGTESLAGAIEVGDYLLPHALDAFDRMGTDEEMAGARRVLGWIEAKGLTEFSVRDAFEALKGHFGRVERLRPALALLVEHYYIRKCDAPPRRGPGRPPSPRYLINPAVSHNSQ